MASFTITIPDNVQPRVIEAVAVTCGYEPTIDGQSNPETRQQFAVRMVRKYLRDTVRNYEAVKASDDAHNAAVQKVEAEVLIG